MADGADVNAKAVDGDDLTDGSHLEIFFDNREASDALVELKALLNT